MTFNDMSVKFSEIVSKAQSKGLTIEDYTLLERMSDDLRFSIGRLLESHDYFNNEFFSAIEEMYRKGMSGVLSWDDYARFKEKTDGLDSKIVSYFSERGSFFPKGGSIEDAGKLLENINDAIDSIDYDRLISGLSREELRYIRRNSFLLPLVLANNTHPRIRMYGDNSYMFLCQFHLERTPSLGVSDLKNLMHCFGCCTNGSSIEYLMGFENLSYRGAVQLLSQIYGFDIGNRDPQLDGLAEKYQKAILSDQYQELLERGQERLRERGIGKVGRINVRKAYESRYATIERVRRGENDPNFVCDGVKQLVYFNGKNYF